LAPRLRIARSGAFYVAVELLRRPELSGKPLTTSALDQITRPIVTVLCPRRYGLKNRERLNRRLLQPHANG
jgi:hypothetical protein